MFNLFETRKYSKDIQKARLSLFQNVKLNICIQALKNGYKLDKTARMKKLQGKWFGYNEISIGWDLRVIYKYYGKQLQLIRIGTHNQLFNDR
jgi:mRNA interferase YafQ